MYLLTNVYPTCSQSTSSPFASWSVPHARVFLLHPFKHLYFAANVATFFPKLQISIHPSFILQAFTHVLVQLCTEAYAKKRQCYPFLQLICLLVLCSVFFFSVTNAHQDAQIVATDADVRLASCIYGCGPTSKSLLCLILYIGQDQAYNVFTRDFNSHFHSAESLPHSLLDKDRWSLSLHSLSLVCLCVSLRFSSMYIWHVFM